MPLPYGPRAGTHGSDSGDPGLHDHRDVHWACILGQARHADHHAMQGAQRSGSGHKVWATRHLTREQLGLWLPNEGVVFGPRSHGWLCEGSAHVALEDLLKWASGSLRRGRRG